jgi:hypothetical protein
MRLVGALDAILRLIDARKSFHHFVDAAWHIPINCRPEGNDISDLEFVRHRFLASVGG